MIDYDALMMKMKIRDQLILIFSSFFFFTENLHVYVPDNRYVESAFIVLLLFYFIMHSFKPVLFSNYVKLRLWDMI